LPEEMLGHVIDILNEGGFDLGDAPGVVWPNAPLKECETTKNPHAKRLKKTYAPEDKDKFNAMTAVFTDAETPKDLDSLLLLYLMDERYARADIAMAEKYTRLSKGWS
jgi:hypothetical protein